MNVTPTIPTRLTPPLRVAVEGVCLSGKTTLARLLARQLGAIQVPEYADLTAIPTTAAPTICAARATLSRLLATEVDRCATGRTASSVALFDRSPLSLIAHEYAVAALGAPSDPITATTWLTRAADAGAIDPPHAYIHLRTPDNATLAARQRTRPPLAHHLAAPAVRDRLATVYTTYFAAAPPECVLILDSTQPSSHLATIATAFVADRAHSRNPAPPPWTALINLFTDRPRGTE